MGRDTGLRAARIRVADEIRHMAGGVQLLERSGTVTRGARNRPIQMRKVQRKATGLEVWNSPALPRVSRDRQSAADEPRCLAESVMSIKLIVAHDSKRGIGRGGDLPWHMPEDLRRVAALTRSAPEGKRNALVMGRGTWESIPAERRPLKGRDNIVVSPTIDAVDGGFVADSLDGALNMSKALDCHDVFIFVGAAVYAEAMARELPDELLLTVVEGDFGCDRFLPEIPTNYELTSSEQHVYGEVVVIHQVWVKAQ